MKPFGSPSCRERGQFLPKIWTPTEIATNKESWAAKISHITCSVRWWIHLVTQVITAPRRDKLRHKENDMRYLLLSCLLFSAGCSIPRFSHERVDIREFETSPLNAVIVFYIFEFSGFDISTFNGSINVVPNDKPVVEMKVTYKAYGESQEAARQNCEQLDCVPEAENGVLKLTATKPQGWVSASAKFELKVPSHCAVTTKTSNGRVNIAGMTQPVSVSTSNGRVEVKDAGDVKVNTSNGTIVVQNANGQIDLDTSNGTVRYAGYLYGTDNRIDTSNGKIEIELPEDQAYDLSSKTSNGSIKCGLTKQDLSKDSKKRINGIIGSGNPAEGVVGLSLSTSNGTIYINPYQEQVAETTAEVISFSDDN